jgi:hypothetical protein
LVNAAVLSILSLRAVLKPWHRESPGTMALEPEIR